jgi:hypothetical protein
VKSEIKLRVGGMHLWLKCYCGFAEVRCQKTKENCSYTFENQLVLNKMDKSIDVDFQEGQMITDYMEWLRNRKIWILKKYSNCYHK